MASDRPKTASLLIAGLATWLVVASPLVYLLIIDPETGESPRVRWWFIAWAGFGAAFTVLHWPRARPLPAIATTLLLGVQTLTALWANALIPIVFEGVAIGGVLLVIVAGELLGVVPLGVAVLWTAAQSTALIWIYLEHWPTPIAVLAGGAYACFQGFALFVASLAARERTGRIALDHTLSELRATQALLEERTRAAERTRISRDLHDVLGHRLVALSLQLEAAAHREGHEATAHVREARMLSKEMLGEVRAVVSALRQEGPIDLRHAVERLIGGIGSFQTHLDIAPNLAIDEPDRAVIILRAVQEALTNAMRHAGAANVWIALRCEASADVLEVRDDGRGGARIRPGHGLRGMQERFESLGGSVRWETQPGGGFRLQGTLPREGGAER